uniref:Hypermethylated in cancer 2 protein n=1 Tax=Schistocephalus solidus TaxID=70667 RepID=A0A0X3NY43_SCHSO
MSFLRYLRHQIPYLSKLENIIIIRCNLRVRKDLPCLEMMSAEDRETLYPLLINQLVYDGYGVFALSLKKILVPNCETMASNKLLKLVKLGLAVSKFLEDSNLKDTIQNAHSFRSNSHFDSSFFSTLNNAHSQQQQQQNGTTSESSTFSSGASQVIKLEPGERDPNAFNFPFTTYPRPWAQVINRSTINLDRDIHELPNGGSPTKLFECSLCGKVFNRRDKVKRHLSELHHGIKAFGCSHCSRRFSRRWEYQRHMQVIHPNLLTLGKDVSKVSSVATPHVSAAHQVVGSQTNTASGTTEAETCSTQAPCNSTASEQCTNSSDPPVTRPIVPSAVSNGVFSAFPMFSGGGKLAGTFI